MFLENNGDKIACPRGSKFAISLDKYAMGEIALHASGVIYYDPKSLGSDIYIQSMIRLGWQLVNFEDLVVELHAQGVEIRADVVSSDFLGGKNIDLESIREYAKTCNELGEFVVEQVLKEKGLVQ